MTARQPAWVISDVAAGPAHAREQLARVIRETPSALSMVERDLAALVVAVVLADTETAREIEARLVDRGVDRRLLDAVPAAAGRWSVTDDDRLDVIAAYAAKLTRAPATVVEGDIVRLRTFGLTDLDIVVLNQLVAYGNYVSRVARGLGPGGEPA